MFEQALLDGPAPTGRAVSTLAGIAAQCAVLTAAVLVPMVFPEALPHVRGMVDIFAPGPPPPPPPPLRTMLVRTTSRVPTATRILVEPRFVPEHAAVFVDPPPVTADAGQGGVEGGVPGGDVNGVPGGIPNLLASVMQAVRPAAIPPKPQAAGPPKPAAAAAPIERIRVGSGVQEARMIDRAIPAYPPLARQARISGRVELLGVIGTDGRIHELKVLGGHPLLIQAALEAVRQWTYRPTLLNGVPVEVEAPITVVFTLSDGR